LHHTPGLVEAPIANDYVIFNGTTVLILISLGAEPEEDRHNEVAVGIVASPPL
jgi:hypothetical protein